VAGNYTDMQTAGSARAGKGGADTNASVKQVAVGGAITGWYAEPKHENTAGGTANAWQSSSQAGGSAATAVGVKGGQDHRRAR
jgi:hypothetical protein